MLRPFLIVGVGGSGGKTLRGLRHSLELRLQQAGWKDGLPDAWQLLHIDTPLQQDGTDFALPFMPADNYHGLVASGGAFETVYGAIMHGNRIPADQQKDVQRQLPDPARVPVDVTKGAGQYRAVGRAVALSKLGDIRNAASNAINRMSDAKALGQLQSLGELLRAKPAGGLGANPTVIVVSSIAGGSGAGQYLDVIEAVKSTIKSEPWAHQFFSLLYAPDVFDQIKGSGGIPSNALATVAETMAGFWTRNPTESTLSIFKSKGLHPSYGGARDRIGAAYPFIVGRQNSKVSFDNQAQVYSAVATSVAAWMTDDKVQGDIDEYATGNWAANVGANVLPDATRLMRPLDQSPPFSALGFGRVSLGREKFLDYAGERFARACVDQMLYAHTSEDPDFKQRTQEEWIDFRAERALESFIRASGMNEETEDRNDVIDALRPEVEREALSAELRHDVMRRVGGPETMDKSGGLDLNSWLVRLTNARAERIDVYLSRDSNNRQRKLDDWVAEAPKRFIEVVQTSISEQGLPVTIELMRKLTDVVRTASDQLRSEAETRRQWVQRLPGMLNDAMSQAPNQESIRPEQTVVDDALSRIEQSFEWESEGRLRDSASTVLDEFRQDFLDPLRKFLESSHEALLSSATARQRSDGRDNEFDFWPRRNDATVPRKYQPAPNERLLVEHTDYPDEFNDLVVSSAGSTRFDDAMSTIMTNLLIGTGDDDAIARDERWSLIANVSTWRPAVMAETGQSVSATRKPRFHFADDPAEYAERAKKWMLRKGTAFAAYITEDLRAYFDGDRLAPNQFKARKDKFREQLGAALGSSEPLVKLNPSLLAEVHGKSVGEGSRLVFSSIPFATGTDMFQITKDVLTSHRVWDENVSPGWFQDSRVDSIEVFAMSGYPYQPVVMDSVMAPVARGWLAERNSADSRAAFWKWKRARPLRESVPCDPQVFDSILRGWYVAKILGQLKQIEHPSDGQGPELQIWDPSANAYVSFPHPLLYGGVAPSHDFPGIIMESLIVALAMCNSEGSLVPLRAYHRLMDLGGESSQVSATLSSWLQDGVMPLSSPTPNADRAGRAGDTLEMRQDVVKSYIDDEIADFESEIVAQDPLTSVYMYPVSWEIRDEIRSGLHALRDGVLETRAKKSGI